MKNRAENTVTAKRSIRRHDDEVACGVRGGILGQKGVIMQKQRNLSKV